MNLETILCSSLVKVLPGAKPANANEFNTGSSLQGEVFAFQLAYKADFHWFEMKITVESELKECIRVRNVELVPVRYLPPEFDEDVVSKETGFLPDLLQDLREDKVVALKDQWKSLWVTVNVPPDCRPGNYPVQIKFEAVHSITKEKTFFASNPFTLEVIGVKLPEQKLINTHWFHSDCLASYYQVDVFSEEYWRIVENFMRSAAEHGINMILTPIFTPPLDTEIGCERPTVQLIKVKLTDGNYSFDFTLLEKWMELAQKCGMKYFEMAHLFTQWGAEYTPKIVAAVDGEEKRIFGWDVKADSKEYADFLAALLPELTAYIDQHGLRDNVYFHCSDEPSGKRIETYKKASAILRRHLKGYKIFDALSELEFYREGLISIPVPSITSVEKFIEAGVPERWTYYCCGPIVTYCNRFIHMTSSRNRIFGSLLYRLNIDGFLHWGFNFYYSCFSKFLIDPYASTSSYYSYPPGDAFLVYPGMNGIPEDSIRYEVFREALQDQRVLELLETKVPRIVLEKMLDSFSPGSEMTMSEYPKGEEAVQALRAQINQMVKQTFC